MSYHAPCSRVEEHAIRVATNGLLKELKGLPNLDRRVYILVPATELVVLVVRSCREGAEHPNVVQLVGRTTGPTHPRAHTTEELLENLLSPFACIDNFSNRLVVVACLRNEITIE